MTTHIRLLYRPRIHTAQYALAVLKHWDSHVFTFDGSALSNISRSKTVTMCNLGGQDYAQHEQLSLIIMS